MYERTFSEGIKAQQAREAEAKLEASEQPTQEIEPVEVPKTRMQRLGGFLLKGLEAMGRPYAGGYGTVRMGAMPPFPRPEQPQPMQEDESHIVRGEE